MSTGITKRQREALDLRIRGLSYPKIADAMGVTTKRAFDLVNGALSYAETKEKLDATLAIELERLDEMQQVAMAILVDSELDHEMRMKAIDRLAKIQERRSKLLGLETTKSEHKIDAPWMQFLADVVVNDGAEDAVQE